MLQTDILVGKYGNRIWVSKNGALFSATNGEEILQLKPWCSASWVRYVPGDPIPTGAVVGGYVGDPSFETYIISGVANDGRKRCGYYNPETKLGYITAVVAEVTTDMDILVLQ